MEPDPGGPKTCGSGGSGTLESREVKYLVVEPHPRGEDPVHGLPRDPRPAPVLVLVVVVRVGRAQRLHLRLLPFAAHQTLYVSPPQIKLQHFVPIITNSVGDPWHFGTDPDPRIRTSD
jgi:hypothetical protein